MHMVQFSRNSLQSGFRRAMPALSGRAGRKYLPLAVFGGLIVLAAWLGARLSWQFAAPPSVAGASVMPGPGAAAAGPGMRTPDNPIAGITKAHLFGAANASAQTAVADAPKTSLDLTLLGVAAGGKGFPSEAIIASGNNLEQHTYAIGASLPGGAIVRDIFPDRVVIAHDGRLESLPLPRAGTSIIAAHMQFDSGNAALNTGYTPRPVNRGVYFPSRLRQQIEQHPQNLSNFMRIRPYAANGKLVGYQVYPGRQPALFQRAGLEPGDIITRVDGIPLDNNADTMRALAKLRNARGNLQIVVRRQGRPVQITLNIPGG